jgi:hypothetical protein
VFEILKDLQTFQQNNSVKTEKKWRKTEKLEKEKKLRGKDIPKNTKELEKEREKMRKSSWKFLSQIIRPKQMDSDYLDSIRVNQMNLIRQIKKRLAMPGVTN